jgi:Tfp pilus assembly protein PilO
MEKNMLIDIYSKSNTSSRIALIASIVFIAAIGSYNWLISPHLQYLEAAQRHANETGSYDKKIKLLESKLKLKKLDADKLSKQIAAMQDLFFTHADAQQAFASLETTAKQTNCTIVSLKMLPDDIDIQKKKAYSDAGITLYRGAIRFVGSYPDIMRFLADLLDCPGKIIINPFSITSSQNDPEKLECSSIITIYVMNDGNKGTETNE